MSRFIQTGKYKIIICAFQRVNKSIRREQSIQMILRAFQASRKSKHKMEKCDFMNKYYYREENEHPLLAHYSRSHAESQM
jgi:hypothetical protein